MRAVPCLIVADRAGPTGLPGQGVGRMPDRCVLDFCIAANPTSFDSTVSDKKSPAGSDKNRRRQEGVLAERVAVSAGDPSRFNLRYPGGCGLSDPIHGGCVGRDGQAVMVLQLGEVSDQRGEDGSVGPVHAGLGVVLPTTATSWRRTSSSTSVEVVGSRAATASRVVGRRSGRRGGMTRP
jgi:hypothetical protein